MSKVTVFNMILGLPQDVINLEKIDNEEYLTIIKAAVRKILKSSYPEVLDFPKDQRTFYTYDLLSLLDDLKTNIDINDVKSMKNDIKEVLKEDGGINFSEDDLDILTAILLPSVHMTNEISDIVSKRDDEIFFMNVVIIPNDLLDRLRDLSDDPDNDLSITYLSDVLIYYAEVLIEEHENNIKVIESLIESIEVDIKDKYKN